jgi:hypothetical protein
MVKKKAVDLNTVLIDKANKLQLKGRDLTLVPILDRDPILAANFLTLKDREGALTVLTDTFRYLKSPLQRNKALELNILLNKETFLWYTKFTTEIDRLVTGKSTVEIPYEMMDEFPKYPMYPFLLLPPIKYYPEKKAVNFEIKKTKDKNPINLWRIKYIREELDDCLNKFNVIFFFDFVFLFFSGYLLLLIIFDLLIISMLLLTISILKLPDIF